MELAVNTIKDEVLQPRLDSINETLIGCVSGESSLTLLQRRDLIIKKQLLERIVKDINQRIE